MSNLRNIGTARKNSGRCIAAAMVALCGLLLAAPAAYAEYGCYGAGGIAIPGGIVAATYNINNPGCYYLAGGRTMTGAAPAISINRSHVFIDLRGHTLTHTQPGQTIITNSLPITNVHIVNGKLTGASGGVGVSLTGCPNGDFNVSDLIIADLGSGVPGMSILIGGGGPTSPAHAVIARNMINVIRFGIILDTVDGGRVEDNVLIGRQSALGPPTLGIQLGDCDANNVRGDTISDISQPGGAGGVGILVTIGSSLNNVQHNTVSRCFEGILVDSSCNVVDWNVAMGNISTGIHLTTTSSDNIYSFNRASGVCNNGGPGLLDAGLNINAGNNF